MAFFAALGFKAAADVALPAIVAVAGGLGAGLAHLARSSFTESDNTEERRDLNKQSRGGQRGGGSQEGGQRGGGSQEWRRQGGGQQVGGSQKGGQRGGGNQEDSEDLAFFAALGFKAAADVALPAIVAVAGVLAAGLLAAHLARSSFTESDNTEERRDLNKQSRGGQRGGGSQEWQRQGGGQQGGGSQKGGQRGGGSQEGGQRGGGNQEDSEDGDSDQESEESESEEETDDEKISGKIQTEYQERFSSSNNQNPPTHIFMGLLNVRSLNNKIPQILNLILKNSLDVLCTTETWLKEDTGCSVLRRASPEDFTFCHQARPTRGGGAAIQVSPSLHSAQILFNCKTTTFEVAATVLQHQDWDEPVLVISLYRRGATGIKFHRFLDEFQDVLCEIFSICNNVIVAGDFNVWVDDLIRGRRFRTLLQAYELDQNVRSPTNRRGHILDLVITRNVEVTRLFVQNDGISDHFSVYFNARPGSKNERKKTKEKREDNEQKKKTKKK